MTTATTEVIAPDGARARQRHAAGDLRRDVATPREQGQSALTVDELYERVIGRLRVLVPRELHNAGERAYLEEKARVCVDGRAVACRAATTRIALAPDPQAWVRYPDDSIRRYTPGLFPARERLDAVNTTGCASPFDISKHVPHNDDPASPEFQRARAFDAGARLPQARSDLPLSGRDLRRRRTPVRQRRARQASSRSDWLELRPARRSRDDQGATPGHAAEPRSAGARRQRHATDRGAAARRPDAAVAQEAGRSWDEIAVGPRP